METNIKNIKEFAKLYSINIPFEEYADYYLTTLYMSQEYKKLPELISAFEDIKDKITASNAHIKMTEFDYSKEKFYSKDELKKHEGELLISFDIKKANYSILKSFDDNKEFPEKWEELVAEMGIHRALALSKGFRQIIFGNINPKRSQKIQQLFMLSFVETLKEKGVLEENIVAIYHDEVIIKPESEATYALENLLKKDFKTATLNGRSIELVPEIFRMNKLLDVKGYVKTFYRIVDLGFGGKHLLNNYSKLFGIPGKKFFYFFKKEILQSFLEEEDLIFKEDGMKAKWIIETKK